MSTETQPELSTAMAAVERQPGGEFVAVVWYCGDDCYCSQPRIEYRWPSTLYPKFSKGKTVWEGTFRSDGEPGATTDLNRLARWLRRHDHDTYVQIRWPWNGTITEQREESRNR